MSLGDWLLGGLITIAFLGGIAAVAATIGAFVEWRFIARRRRLRAETEASFVQVLSSAVHNAAVNDLDELQELYRAHFDVPSNDIHDTALLSRLVRRAIHQIASAKHGPSEKQFQRTLPVLRSLLTANEAVHRREEQKAPFADVPTPDRQLLEDILELTSGDKDIVKNKLAELGRSVGVRQRTIDQLADQGMRSLSWAKRGLAGTIAFSLISITLALYTLFRGQ